MKKIWSYAGILAGILTIILGFTVLHHDYGHSTINHLYTSYGADFYTDIYRATVTCSNKLIEASYTLAKGFGYLLISLGLAETCLFGSKITRNVESYQSNTGESPCEES